MDKNINGRKTCRTERMRACADVATQCNGDVGGKPCKVSTLGRSSVATFSTAPFGIYQHKMMRYRALQRSGVVATCSCKKCSCKKGGASHVSSSAPDLSTRRGNTISVLRKTEKSVGVSAVKTENAIPSKGNGTVIKTETKRGMSCCSVSKAKLGTKEIAVFRTTQRSKRINSSIKDKDCGSGGTRPLTLPGNNIVKRFPKQSSQPAASTAETLSSVKSDDKSRGCNTFRRSLLPLPSSASPLKLYGPNIRPANKAKLRLRSVRRKKFQLLLETIPEEPEPEQTDGEVLERGKRLMQRERVLKLKKSLEEANSIYLADIAAIRTEAAEKLKNILMKNREKINKSNVSSILKIVRPLVSPGNNKLEMGETHVFEGFSGDIEKTKKRDESPSDNSSNVLAKLSSIGRNCWASFFQWKRQRWFEHCLVRPNQRMSVHR